MQKIPLSAADRILRNPHSLPGVPNALNSVVSKSQWSDRTLEQAEEAHLRRRERINNLRNDRINFEESELMDDGSAISDTEFENATGILAPLRPLRPRSRSVNALSSPLSLQPQPQLQPPGSPSMYRQTRHTSVDHISTGSPSHSYHRGLRRHSMVEKQLQLPRTGMFYSIDDTDAALFGRANTNSVDSPYYFSMRSSTTISPHRTSTFWSPSPAQSPQDRARQRCLLFKRPHPSYRPRMFPGQNLWQPGWHRLLRQDYLRQGKAELWRQERNKFLQDFRRERQFQKQTKRRMSFS